MKINDRELFGAFDRMVVMENYSHMTDAQVLARMDDLARAERGAISDALACLAEVDRRKLYAELAYPSLFEYCVGHLRLSAGSAFRRAHSARAAHHYPEIYVDIREGALSMCVVALLTKELGIPALKSALPIARGKSKREVEEWLAARRPPAPAAPDRVVIRPPLPASPGHATVVPTTVVPTTVVPTTVVHTTVAPAGACSKAEFGEAVPPGPRLEPLGATLPAYEYAFTASPELHRAIERLKDMLWSKHPFGSLDDFLKIAVIDYVDRHDPALIAERGKRRRPPGAPGGRVTRRVRSIVWARDGGRCVFTAGDGRRCQCRRGLEIDHVMPLAYGGKSDDPSNLRLLCREHNQSARRATLGEGRFASPGT